MADIVIGVRSYCKMILHATKYPHKSINGVFLAEKKGTKERGNVYMVDCMPLFHINLSLTPMLEIAMMQLEQYCKDHSLVIAGYYQANEHIDDCTPNFVANRIADKIHDHFPDACLVMVDNRKMTKDCLEVAFQLYHFHDGKWNLKDKNHVHIEQGHNSLEVTAELMSAKIYRKLVDFDNHLDDITLDWTNVLINGEVERSVSQYVVKK